MSTLVWAHAPSRAATRQTIAVLCALDATILQWTALSSPAGLTPQAEPLAVLGWLRTQMPAQMLLLALVWWGLWQFARHARLGPALLAAVADGVLYETHVAAFGRIEAEFLIPRASLVGWLAGAALLRGAVRPEDRDRVDVADRGGWQGALAIFAATYVAAGLSKIFRSGMGWADPRTIGYIVLANLPQGLGWRTTLDQFVLTHHSLAAGLAGLTLVLELGALLMLGPGWARSLACLSIFAFHTSLFAMVGLISPGSHVLALAYGLPWPSLIPRWRQMPETTVDLDPARARKSLAVASVVVIALMALAWGTQLREAFRIQPTSRLHPWDPEPAEATRTSR